MTPKAAPKKRTGKKKMPVRRASVKTTKKNVQRKPTRKATPQKRVSKTRRKTKTKKQNLLYQEAVRALTWKAAFTVLLVIMLTIGGVDVFAVNTFPHVPLIRRMTKRISPEQPKEKISIEKNVTQDAEYAISIQKIATLPITHSSKIILPKKKTVSVITTSVAEAQQSSTGIAHTSLEVAEQPFVKPAPIQHSRRYGGLQVTPDDLIVDSTSREQVVNGTQGNTTNARVQVPQITLPTNTTTIIRERLAIPTPTPVVLPPQDNSRNEMLVSAVQQLIAFLQDDIAQNQARTNIQDVVSNTFATNNINVHFGDNANNSAINITSDVTADNTQNIHGNSENNVNTQIGVDDVPNDPHCESDQDSDQSAGSGSDLTDEDVHIMCDEPCESDCDEARESNDAEGDSTVVEEADTDANGNSTSEEEGTGSGVNIDTSSTSDNVQNVLGNSLNTIQNTIGSNATNAVQDALNGQNEQDSVDTSQNSNAENSDSGSDASTVEHAITQDSDGN